MLSGHDSAKVHHGIRSMRGVSTINGQVIIKRDFKKAPQVYLKSVEDMLTNFMQLTQTLPQGFCGRDAS